MELAVFSTKSYDRAFLQEANRRHHHELEFFEARLLTFPNVIITGHQAFFTCNALMNTAESTR